MIERFVTSLFFCFCCLFSFLTQAQVRYEIDSVFSSGAGFYGGATSRDLTRILLLPYSGTSTTPTTLDSLYFYQPDGTKEAAYWLGNSAWVGTMSADGTVSAVGCDDETVLLFSGTTLTHRGPISGNCCQKRGLALSPNKRYLTVGGNTLTIHDLSSSTPLTPVWTGLPTMTQCRAMDFSGSGRYLAFGGRISSAESYIGIVDMQTLSLIFSDTMLQVGNGEVRQIAMSYDGNMLICGTFGGSSTKLYYYTRTDTSTHTWVMKQEKAVGSSIYWVDMDSSGRKAFVSAQSDGLMMFQPTADSLQTLWQYGNPGGSPALYPMDGGARYIWLSTDGTKALATTRGGGSGGGQFYLFNASTGQVVLHHRSFAPFVGPGYSPSDSWFGAVSDDGSKAVYASHGGRAYFFNQQFSPTWTASGWQYATPDSTTDAIIASEISTPSFSAKSLYISSGIKWNLAAGQTARVFGDIHNQGNGQSGAGRIEFRAASLQQFYGNPFYTNAEIAIATGAQINTNNRLYLVGNGQLLHGALTPGASGNLTGNIYFLRNGHNSPTRYDYWSSPVSGAILSQLGGQNIRRFDSASNAWLPSASNASLPETNPMTTGTGFIATSVDTARFFGSPHNGTFNLPMSFNPMSSQNWNLIGNPYPSAYNGPQFLLSNPSVNGAIYFWQQDFATSTTFTSADYTARNLLSGSFVIPACQGFFVDAVGPGVQFRNQYRNATNTAMLKINPERIYLGLEIDGGLKRTSLIGRINDASTGYDKFYDAPYLSANTKQAFYSLLEQRPMAIQGLPADFEGSIDLGYAVEKPATITLTIDSSQSFFNELWLEDRMLKRFILLTKSPYSFRSEAGTHHQRLTLHFKGAGNQGSSNDLDQLVWVDLYGNLYWKPQVQSIDVISKDGRTMHAIVTNGLASGETKTNLANGLYLLKANTASGSRTVKVYLP